MRSVWVEFTTRISESYFCNIKRLYITYHSFDAIFWFFCSKEITRFGSALGFLVKWRKHWNCNAKFIKRITWVRSTYDETTELGKKIFEIFTGRKRFREIKSLTTVWNVWHFLRYKFLPDRLDVYLQRNSPSGWLPPGKESILRVPR